MLSTDSYNVHIVNTNIISLLKSTLFESESIKERHNYFETVLSYILGLSGMLSTEILVTHFVVHNDYTFDTKIIFALFVFMLYVINGMYINLYILLDRKVK